MGRDTQTKEHKNRQCTVQLLKNPCAYECNTISLYRYRTSCNQHLDILVLPNKHHSRPAQTPATDDWYWKRSWKSRRKSQFLTWSLTLPPISKGQKANERWTSPLPLAMTKYVPTRPCGVIWQKHRNLHVLRMYKCPVFQEAMVVTLKHVLKGGHKYSKNVIIPKVFTHKSGRKGANAEQVHIHFQWWR